MRSMLRPSVSGSTHRDSDAFESLKLRRVVRVPGKCKMDDSILALVANGTKSSSSVGSRPWPVVDPEAFNDRS